MQRSRIYERHVGSGCRSVSLLFYLFTLNFTYTGEELLLVSVLGIFRSTIDLTEEVYRGNTIYKNSYCKSLLVLFIWLIAFSRCLQLFLCENPVAYNFKFFTKNFRAPYKESFVCQSPETLKTGYKLTEQYCYSIFKSVKQIILKF